MTDIDHLLEEIAAAQDHTELTTHEHAATRLIEELTARLTDAIQERREYLNRHRHFCRLRESARAAGLPSATNQETDHASHEIQ